MKIRLIECFAGIGSQAAALKRLNADFEHYRVIEFDKYAIASYNAINGTNFEPTDIRNVKGKDLGIQEKDKYTYVLTYSFPCQDLSVAGQQRGMSKGDGTRSGLLWEVERLLNECDELPQVLLMENVNQVHSEKNMNDFQKWLDFLESKGYTNHWKDLNSRDYGVAQNRLRTFMISFLGDVNFRFPKPIPLTKRMKDYLEDKVDEKFYVNSEKAKALIKKLEENGGLGEKVSNNGTQFYQQDRVYSSDGVAMCLPSQLADGSYKYAIPISTGGKKIDIASTILSGYERSNMTGFNKDNGVVQIKQATDKGFAECEIGGVADLSFPGSQTRRDRVQERGQVSPTITVSGIDGLNRIESQYRIRKLTPLECWRLMGFTDEEFRKAESVNSNTQLYKQAGNSIVVDVLVAIFDEMLKSLNGDSPKYEDMEQMSLFDYI